ncbi:Histone-lysine N-methyltransferase SUVR4 [Linum perenne]
MGRERAQRAFEATKALGLPKNEVKPVLLELLKSSDYNWDFIEAEDYKILVETYFEAMESKVAADMRSGSKDDPVLWKLAKTEQVELPKGQAQAPSVAASSSSAAVATPTTLVQKVADETRNKGVRKDHHCYLDDITNGIENVRISLVDDYGREELPKFSYIRSSTVYQDAKLQFSLARISDADCCSSCVGDCVAQPVPCACSSETGGDFAYTRQGVLTDDFLEACLSMTINPQNHQLFFCEDCPLARIKNESMTSKCSGHLIRKFIKECGIKCRCHMSCANRVVQRGITCKLQVFATREGKGWGVRALQDLPRGTFVCEYAGEILTNTELYERNVHTGGGDGRHTYPVTLDADWGSERTLSDDDALCLDATNWGNVARFINHRCHDANLTNIPVEVETPDRHYYHVALFTVREVKAQEELTWDYGIDFDDHDHPIKAFKCLCGSRYCRYKKPKRKLEIVKFDSDSD